jgi:hypothetical protein
VRRPPSRRDLLAGGAACVGLAGCSSGGSPAAPSPSPVDPERVLVGELMADKERTIGLYSTLISSGAARLTPFRGRHEAHLAELRRRFPDVTPSSPAPGAPEAPPSSGGTASPGVTGSPGATASPSATASAGATASPQKVSLTRLRDVERRAAALRPRQLADASPALAQLIASIGACETLHVLALPRSL